MVAVRAEVGGRRRHAVGAGRDEAPLARLRQALLDPAARIASDAVVRPCRVRRHRHADVLARQGDGRVRVGAGRASIEPGQQRALPPRPPARPVGRGPRLARGARAPRASRGRAGARRFADATLVSSRSAVSFADQPSTSRRITNRALARGQELDEGEEGELDRLAGDRGRRRAPPRSGRPRRAAGRGTAAATGGRRTSRPSRDAARPAPQTRRGTAFVPVEPRPQPGPGVEPRPPAPRAQERLLDEVLRLVERAEHPVAVDVQLAPVALGEAAERRLVGEGSHGWLDASRRRTVVLMLVERLGVGDLIDVTDKSAASPTFHVTDAARRRRKPHP